MIFLTALTDTADKVRAFDTGGVDYVTKPFQFEEVLARVKTHVALRRAQVALAESYARLRALEQLRDDLVHMIVHDMRSPLTALLLQPPVPEGPGRRAQRRQPRGPAGRDQVGRSAQPDGQRSARREPARRGQDAGRARGLGSDADGQTTCARRWQPWIAIASIDIESAGAVEVSCDGALVRRIMENLVSNGIRHTPAGSRVAHLHRQRRRPRARRRARRGRRRASGSQREDLREVRHRRELGTNGPITPSALGLAFCKLAIEAHGGTIGVDRRCAGRQHVLVRAAGVNGV